MAVNDPKSDNITWHSGGVTRERREDLRGHRGATLWFTGLSGAGKSTLATRVEQALTELGHVSYFLDGDNLRHGLCRDLSFSPDDRRENIRRTGEIAKLFNDAGVLVLCALISPYRSDRDAVRKNMREGDFIEIHVHASLAACEARDPKGLYRKARAGDIVDMTGISAPYEPPECAELTVDTESEPTEQGVARVLGFLRENGYIP